MNTLSQSLLMKRNAARRHPQTTRDGDALNLKKLAGMVFFAGLGLVVFRTLKLVIYGKLAAATLGKAKDLIAAKEAKVS